MLSVHTPLTELPVEELCVLLSSTARDISPALLDAAVPPAELRKALAQLHAKLRETRTELKMVRCTGCNRDVRATEYEGSEAMCDRRSYHKGEYQANYGWSCCGARHKRTEGCSPSYCLHKEPVIFAPPQRAAT